MRKSARLLSLLLMPMLAACPPTVDSDLGTMRVTNSTSKVMTALYFGPTGENLGDNRLTSFIQPGSARTIVNLPIGVAYDFRANFGTYERALFDNVSFAEGQTRTWYIRAADVEDVRVTEEILDMEEELLELVNAERVDGEIATLTMRESLRLIARAHSQDMIARDFFSSEDPDGDDFLDRLDDGGITYETAGENLGFLEVVGEVFVEDMLEFWLEDTEGASENILDPEFTQTGIGISTDGNGYYTFTHLFIDQSGKLRVISDGAFVLER